MAAIADVSNRGRMIAVHTMQSTSNGETTAELPSLDGDNDTKAEPLSKDPTDKGKKVVAGCLPPRPPPRRPGWGRDPSEDIFHMVPRSRGGPDRKRAVILLWSRDPNSKTIMLSEKPRGTLSPDGYPWGATLYDFYIVNRIPAIPSAMTIMTGSEICEVMKELAELDPDAPEVKWAESEGKPRVEGVANTEVLIESAERRVQLGVYNNFSMLDDVRNMALPDQIDKEDQVERASEGKKGEHEGKHDEERNKEDVVEQAPGDNSGDAGDNNDECDDMKVDPASIPPPLTMPITSPFHPSHYPKPWPFIPFETPLSILLQERIPLYLLPQTLYVHDPFNLLPALERTFRDTSWMPRPDIIRTYNLSLSETIRKEVEEARRKAEELEVYKSRTLIILRYMRTKEQIENHEPAIEVPLPPYPRHMTKVEESHLYLSPVAKVGQGHHSIVYEGEWELPRDMFARPKICQKCFKEATDKEIWRLKHTGRWEKMLRAAGWGSTGFTGRQPTQAELDEVSDGEIIKRIICVVPPTASPSQVLQTLDGRGIFELLMEQKNTNTVQLNFPDLDGDGGESTKDEDSHVTTIRINPPFSYESQKTCTHGLCSFSVPRTAKFTVVAKLSLENDYHLVREARNYQRFPEHLFHHYNGYTLISQLHTTVPVNAVVPQFYGYYTPKENQGQESYLSPILLLEHCGEPIQPEKLSLEDQQECASLLLRFHRAGWLHESVAPRNFLVQYGKPTEFPIKREVNPEPSFRLIDFGRSRKFETAKERGAEKMGVLCMFEKLIAKMAVIMLSM